MQTWLASVFHLVFCFIAAILQRKLFGKEKEKKGDQQKRSLFHPVMFSDIDRRNKGEVNSKNLNAF